MGRQSELPIPSPDVNILRNIMRRETRRKKIDEEEVFTDKKGRSGVEAVSLIKLCGILKDIFIFDMHNSGPFKFR